MTAGDPHREAARRSPGHGTWPAGHYRRSLPVRPLRRQGRRSAGFQDLNSQALHHHATLSSSRVRCLFAKKSRASARGRVPIRRQIALPRRGTENLRSLLSAFARSARTGEARTLVSPTPSVVDRGRRCRSTMAIRSPPFDSRRPVWRSHRRRSKSKTVKQRVLTSSSGAWSSSRPFSPLTSSSSFASSPCCPPSQWVSGDIVQCPRGSRTLSPDYYSATKTPVFLHIAQLWGSRRYQMLRFNERGLRARNVAHRRRAKHHARFHDG